MLIPDTTDEKLLDVIYQGEVDEEGRRDGRGISIEPGSVLVVGRYKRN